MNISTTTPEDLILTFKKSTLSIPEETVIIFKFLLFLKENKDLEDDLIFLFQKTKISDTFYWSLFLIDCCAKDLFKAVTFLLDNQKAQAYFNNNNCLLKACANGNIDIVKIILNDPLVQPALINHNPIEIASNNKHYNICHLLYLREDIKNMVEQLDLTKKNNILNSIDIFKINNKIKGF